MPFPSMHSVANGKGFLELAEKVGGREKYPVEVRVGLTLVPPHHAILLSEALVIQIQFPTRIRGC